MKMVLGKAWIFLVLTASPLLWPAQLLAAACPEEPFLPLTREQYPLFLDDMSQESLVVAIEASLRYLSRLPEERTFRLCGEEYPASWLRESLYAFQEIMVENPEAGELGRVLAEEFTICRAAGRKADRRMLFTGYFEPLFRGSLERTAVYRHPLYLVPGDLVQLPAAGGLGRATGRMENSTLLPYWTRAEIEKGRLLAGHELLYLADPVDAFILHIQGSGQVVLPDGQVRRVQFAALNGHEYRSIGRFMAEKGLLRLDEVTLPKIVRYLKDNPEEQEAILHHNESFVFFRWGESADAGPLGSLGEPLTAGRSVALDQSCFPAGGLAFLTTRKPRINDQGVIAGWEPMGRFVLNQDSGSAIKGPGRLDLYWGSGLYAEVAAGHMKQPGSLYFLVKKRNSSGTKEEKAEGRRLKAEGTEGEKNETDGN